MNNDRALKMLRSRIVFYAAPAPVAALLAVAPTLQLSKSKMFQRIKVKIGLKRFLTSGSSVYDVKANKMTNGLLSCKVN
jgi:hypothetical protein